MKTSQAADPNFAAFEALKSAAATQAQQAAVQAAIQTARDGAAKSAVHAHFPWDQDAKLDAVAVCDDSCPAAKDGQCNDGRGGMQQARLLKLNPCMPQRSRISSLHACLLHATIKPPPPH